MEQKYLTIPVLVDEKVPDSKWAITTKGINLCMAIVTKEGDCFTPEEKRED